MRCALQMPMHWRFLRVAAAVAVVAADAAAVTEPPIPMAATQGPEALLWQSPADANTGGYDAAVLVATLQGLVNRERPPAATAGASATASSEAAPTRRPLLFVDSTLLFTDFAGADRHWAAYLERTKGVRFTNMTGASLDALVEATSWAAGGAVLYGTPEPVVSDTGGNINTSNVSVVVGGDPDGARYAALTLCGVEGLVPVTAALRAAHPAVAALPVRYNLTGRWKSSEEAYRWALAELMPRVNRSVGWSAGRSHVADSGATVWQGGPPELAILGLDLAVARRGFMFNLSPNATLVPSEAALFDDVMTGLNGTAGSAAVGTSTALPAIYGWSEPESEYTIRVSRGGGFVLCSCAPNLSLWARIVSASLAGAIGRAARAAEPADPEPLRNKVYVTFQTNEGDTPKIVAGLFGGSWLNANRGAVPVAWGVNPVLAREFPALMEHFASTATANDTFFAATSGSGYAFPSEMPPEAFKRYAGQTEALAEAYVAPPRRGAPPDWTVDIWNWAVPEGKPGPWRGMIDAYASAAPSVGAFTQQSIGPNATTVCAGIRGDVAVTFAPQSLWYPGSPNAPWTGDRPTRESALDDIEARIRTTRPAAQPMSRPVFTLVYGLIDGGSGPGGLDAVDAALAMAKRLPRDEFEVVGAQEMARLSRESCKAAVAAGL